MDLSERLDVLLARIGSEVTGVADHVRSIELGGALSPTDLVELQKLDLVEQTLRSLATVLAAIAGSAAGPARIDLGDAVDRLPLADLGLRLRGAPAATEAASGQVDLF